MQDRYHLIGIGGAGMSAIAEILRERGEIVSGSDQKESEVTERLRGLGIRVHIGHQAENVEGATLSVYSAAIPPDNPERQAGCRMGIPAIERSVMLGRLMAGFRRRVAIAGTHGKTTTTSMTAMVLMQVGLDPTVLIGGDLDAFGGNARAGQSDVFVTEACEAFSSFLELHPSISIVTNIDADHMEHYKTMDGVLAAFRQFLTQTDEDGLLVLCLDDENVQRFIQKLDRRTVIYSVKEPADISAQDINLGPRASYTLVRNGEGLGRITLALPGLHYVGNSLAAAAVGFELGATFEQVRDGLERYRGNKRRFEVLGTARGVTIVDDYAHHPNEIEATLKAARSAYPGRIIAIFQPHLYSRTERFQAEFARALSLVDAAIVTDIYPSREKPIEGVTSKLIVKQMDSRAEYISNKRDVPARAREMAREGDAVIVMGAGDIREEAEALLLLLRE